MQDNEIIDLYWARCETAITRTAEKYGRYCYSISYNILHSYEDAEECVNDTYLGAWKSMPPQRPNRLSTYLGKITRNLSINRYKLYSAKKRGSGQTEIILSELNDCIPAPNSIEHAVGEMVLVESINHFLYGLPKIKRNVFISRYWYMNTIHNIAHQYGISKSKTASMLFRLRIKLKLHLEKEGIEI